MPLVIIISFIVGMIGAAGVANIIFLTNEVINIVNIIASGIIAGIAGFAVTVTFPCWGNMWNIYPFENIIKETNYGTKR